MPSIEDLRVKAQQYQQMATETTNSLAATLLRIVAEDYMELAEKEAARQQQIQPEKPEEHEVREVFGY
jgi:hypothetical protein